MTSPEHRLRRRSGGRPTLTAAEVLSDTIVEKAWVLFQEHGYRRTSVEAIARSAKVSKRTIYDRFNSKEALLEAVLSSAIRKWREQAWPIYERASSKEWLEDLIDHLLNVFSSKEAVALSSLMITEGYAYPGAVRVANEERFLALQDCAARLRLRVEGFPDGADGEALAFTFLALIQGYASMSRDAGGQPAITTEARRRIWSEARWIFQGYGCRAPS